MVVTKGSHRAAEQESELRGRRRRDLVLQAAGAKWVHELVGLGAEPRVFRQ
jgi:hypothetical protein